MCSGRPAATLANMPAMIAAPILGADLLGVYASNTCARARTPLLGGPC